jgi:hypothetical protein
MENSWLSCIGAIPINPNYGISLSLLLRSNVYLLAFGAGAPFLRAAHRAFIAAANLARPAAVIPPFFLPDFTSFGVEVDPPFALAHLAR